MGLSNFLGRSTPDNGSLDDSPLAFRAQAYQSTSPALPPVRGSLPVPGNGPNAMSGMQRAAEKRTRALHAGTALDWPAPAPLVPRLRGGSSDRPSTAPTSHPSVSPPPMLSRPTTSRRRHDSIRGSISLLRRATSNGDLARRLNTPDDGVFRPPVPPIPSYHLGSETSLATSRSQGFVDLLDAQSELKPSDFRSRIKAAGARDYGEDVAERNMGENAVDLANPAVKAFYASSQRPDDSAPPPTIPRGDRPRDTQRPRAYGTHSAESSLSIRPKSAGTSLPTTFPKRTTSFQPWRADLAVDDTEFRPAQQAVRTGSVRSARRMSMHEYLPLSENTRPRPRPLSLHPVVSSYSVQPTMVPDMLLAGPRTRDGLLYEPVDPPLSPRQPRDSIVVAKKKRSTDDTPRVPSLPHDYAVAARYLNQSSDDTSQDDRVLRTKRPVGPSSKGKARQPASRRGTSNDSSQAGTKLHENLAYPPVALKSRTSAHPEHHGHPKMVHNKTASDAGGRGSRRNSDTTRAVGSPKGSDYSSPPSHSHNFSIGGTLLPPQPQLDEISEDIPGRSSSKRHWSLSSSTPPTTASSSQSSNAFTGAHSQHTADTSVDLSYCLPLLKDGYGGTPSSVGNSSYFTAAEDDVTNDTVSTPRNGTPNGDREGERKPRLHGRESFGVRSSGYTTTEESDVDSFMEKRLGIQRARDDESLLYRSTGYGERGSGLPGLFDEPLSPTLSDWSTTQATSDLTIIGGDLTPRGGLRPPNSIHNPRWPFIGSDFTVTPSGGWSAVADYGEDFGVAYDRAPVQPVAKIDPRSAAQLRKEVKKRNRRATMESSHARRFMRADTEERLAVDSES